MKLLGNTVLVNNFKPLDDRKESLIALPEDRFDRVAVVRGTVMHIGKKAKDNSTQAGDTLKEGMTVLVPNHLGTLLGDGSKIYDYDDILAIV